MATVPKRIVESAEEIGKKTEKRSRTNQRRNQEEIEKKAENKSRTNREQIEKQIENKPRNRISIEEYQYIRLGAVHQYPNT